MRSSSTVLPASRAVFDRAAQLSEHDKTLDLVKVYAALARICRLWTARLLTRTRHFRRAAMVRQTKLIDSLILITLVWRHA
jgi:hypothetical protein